MKTLLLFLLLGAAGLWAQNQNLGNVTVNNIQINGACSGNCLIPSTITANVNGVINPTAQPYGFVGNGTTGDTAKLQAAINAATSKQTVMLPSGTYQINGTITFCSVNNVTFMGASAGLGIGSTTLQLTGALSSPVINTCTATDWEISNMQIRHIGGTPSPGGDGILACHTQSCNRPIISGVNVTNNWNGFNLGPTTNGRFSNSGASANYSHGVFFQGIAAQNGMQWEVDFVVSQLNNGFGFYALPVTGGGNMSFSQWNRPYTFANTAGGIFISSATSAPAADVNISNGFGSSDGNNEINLNTFGQDISITGGFYELAGRTTTGVGNATAPSGLGSGILISGNNTGVVISNNTFSSHSVDGITDSGTGTIVTGNYSHENLRDGYVEASATPGTVTGNIFRLNGRYGINTGLPGPCLSGNSSFNNTSGDTPVGKAGCSTSLTGATGTITGTALTNSCNSGTATVTGAQIGSSVAVSTTDGTDVGGAFNVRGIVSVANTVTVLVCGNGTPPSKAYNVKVIP